MAEHLGPALARKPMHMFWLLDVSGSMAVDGKIEALNDAMRVAVASARTAAAENPGVEVFARAITFAHDAAWHHPDPIPIGSFEWSDVDAVERGTTEAGRAIALATGAIRDVSRAGRGLPPALILVSDGKPTDLKAPSYGAALRALADEPWGKKASRIAIGIGRDADMDALHRFIGHDELPPLSASNADELRHYLRWASTVAVDGRSRPVVDWPEHDIPGTPVVNEEATVLPSGPLVEVEEEATVLPSDAAPAPLESEPTAPVTAPPPTSARRDLPAPPGATMPPPPRPPASDEGPVW